MGSGEPGVIKTMKIILFTVLATLLNPARASEPLILNIFSNEIRLPYSCSVFAKPIVLDGIFKFSCAFDNGIGFISLYKISEIEFPVEDMSEVGISINNQMSKVIGTFRHVAYDFHSGKPESLSVYIICDDDLCIHVSSAQQKFIHQVVNLLDVGSLN